MSDIVVSDVLGSIDIRMFRMSALSAYISGLLARLFVNVSAHRTFLRRISRIHESYANTVKCTLVLKLELELVVSPVRQP